MRDIAPVGAGGVDAMNAWDYKVSRHRYARLRPSRTATATEPLSDRMSQDLRPPNSGTRGRSSQTVVTFVADTMTFEPEGSSQRFSGNRHTYNRIRLLRAELDSLARG